MFYRKYICCHASTDRMKLVLALGLVAHFIEGLRGHLLQLLPSAWLNIKYS